MYKSVVYTRGSESRGQAPGKPARATRGATYFAFSYSLCAIFILLMLG